MNIFEKELLRVLGEIEEAKRFFLNDVIPGENLEAEIKLLDETLDNFRVFFGRYPVDPPDDIEALESDDLSSDNIGKFLKELDRDGIGWKLTFGRPSRSDDIDFGELGDKINFLELDLIAAFKIETDEETKEKLEAAREKIAGALAIVRSIGS